MIRVELERRAHFLDDGRHMCSRGGRKYGCVSICALHQGPDDFALKPVHLEARLPGFG